uniref:Uncharacterized protein n=1 Tax=Timema poppense TaxID=170557 RepID=A0A7R9H1B3_TIMPO|nr:unnamed protein product [Timema poppensis]
MKKHELIQGTIKCDATVISNLLCPTLYYPFRIQAYLQYLDRVNLHTNAYTNVLQILPSFLQLQYYHFADNLDEACSSDSDRKHSKAVNSSQAEKLN